MKLILKIIKRFGQEYWCWNDYRSINMREVVGVLGLLGFRKILLLFLWTNMDMVLIIVAILKVILISNKTNKKDYH